MAHPALKARLMWMAVRPRPISGATRPDVTFMFLSSVTARMMTRSTAVPRAWSITRVTLPETLLGYEAKMPAASVKLVPPMTLLMPSA